MPAPDVTKYSPIRSPRRWMPDVSMPCPRKVAIGAVAEVVGGHRAREADVMAEPGERGRDIRLGARDPDVELRRLQDQLAPRRREPQHDFAEREELAHQRASHPPSTARIWPWT